MYDTYNLLHGTKQKSIQIVDTNRGRMSQAFLLCQMRSLIDASTPSYLSCDLMGLFL